MNTTKILSTISLMPTISIKKFEVSKADLEKSLTKEDLEQIKSIVKAKQDGNTSRSGRV